jgi:hypothetical protein
MVNIHGVGELDLGVPWLEGAAPAVAATRPCSGEAGARAFLNQASLKLGQGPKDVEHEFTGRRGGIDREGVQLSV